MSYQSTISNLIAIIDGLGYRRIPENKTAEEAATSHEHKSYELRFRGMKDLVQRVSNNISYEHGVLLRAKYRNLTPDEMDTNADLIIALITAIKNDVNFVSFIGDVNVTDLNNKFIVMEVNFLYGIAGC